MTWLTKNKGVFLITVALLQPSLGLTQSPANWLVNCNNAKNAKILNCAMSQTIRQKGTRQRIASAVLSKNQNFWVMAISLPHGLDIESGVQISIDQEEAKTHLFSTADATGIHTRYVLDNQSLAKLRNGKSLNLKVTSRSKDAIKMEIPLSGFSSSFALLSK